MDVGWAWVRRRARGVAAWVRRGGFGAARDRSLRGRLALADHEELAASVGGGGEPARERWRFQESWTDSRVLRGLHAAADHVPFVDSMRLNARRRTLRVAHFALLGWLWLAATQALFYALSLGSFELAAVLTFFVLPLCGFCGFLCTRSFLCPFAIFAASVSVWIGGFYFARWYGVSSADTAFGQSAALAPDPPGAGVFFFSDAFVFVEFAGGTLASSRPIGEPKVPGVQGRQSFDGVWRCVAPVVPESFYVEYAGNRNLTAVAVHYWAACVSPQYACDSPEFRAQSSCRRNWDVQWRAGVRLSGGDYDAAVAAAERAYGLTSDPERVVLEWVSDPEDAEAEYLQDWVLTLVLAHAVYLLVAECALVWSCVRFGCDAAPEGTPGTGIGCC